MKQQKFAYIKYGVGIFLGIVLSLWGMSEYLPLLIPVGLALAGFCVFKLIKRKQSPPVEEDPLYRPQDDAHSSEIARFQRNIKLTKLASGALTVVAVILLIVTASGGSVVPLIIVALVVGVIQLVQSNIQSKLKKYVAENITRAALEEVFAVTEYRPFGSIDSAKIRGSHFGIGDFDKSGGTDYVRGTYQGLPIEMCDLNLTEKKSRIKEDGTTEEYDETVFAGFWMICDFGKELSADIRLWERGKLGKVFGGQGIQTENEHFNKQFHIESAIEEEAFYILTPHMMEYILEMDRKAGGDTHLRFERGGKVHIAIGGRNDTFEVGKKTVDATELRRQFVAEIRSITDLIDELRLVDTLYRK